jgi:hypothetical protein
LKDRKWAETGSSREPILLQIPTAKHLGGQAVGESLTLLIRATEFSAGEFSADEFFRNTIFRKRTLQAIPTGSFQPN